MRTLAEKYRDISLTRQGQRLVQALYLARRVDVIIDEAIKKAVNQKSIQPINEARQQLARFLQVELIKTANWFYRKTATELAKATPDKLGQSMVVNSQESASKKRREQDERNIFDVVGDFLTIEPDSTWSSLLFKPPTLSELTSLINFDAMKKRIESMFNADLIQSEIVKGVVDGESNQSIARRLASVTNGDRVAARRIARTETHRIAQRMVEKSINDLSGPLLRGYRYVATLDSRTRNHHAELDGKIYKLKDSRPVLPNEPNCRCTYTPVLKQSLTKKFAPLQGVFSDAQRASIDGPEPDHVQYSQWFNRQSKSRQIKIIGLKNWQKLKSTGDVSWRRFASMKNSPAKKKPLRTQKGRKVLKNG